MFTDNKKRANCCCAFYFSGRYYKLSGALGASFFALSDGILGVNKFNFSVPGEAFLILFFYYLGQMLIALSVVDQIPYRSPQAAAKDLTE